MTQTTVSPARRAETAAQLRRGRILRTVRSILRHLLLALLAAIWLVPILWLLVTSFSTDRGINVRQFFPASYTLRNYVNILFHPDSVAQFPRWFTNTLVVACFNCVISTCFVLMVAYALSCCRFKGRKLIQNLSVSVNLFPGVLAMIAVYFVLKYLNLTNSYAGLIMVYAGSSGLGYLICKGFFDTIPISLREAAKLDGASDARVFFQVVLPMSKPILVYTIISSFMVPWTDFVMAKMILNSGVSADWTVAIGLYNMLQKTLINNYFALFCAGGVLVSIPISILLGLMCGVLLNRAKGREMITSYIISFFVNGVYMLVVLYMMGPIIPIAHNTLKLPRGYGIRNTVSLLPMRQTIDNALAIYVGGVKIPVLTLIIIAVACLFIVWFRKTKLGQDMRAVGQDMEVARDAGINVERTRIISMVISTVFAGFGMIIYLQNLGNFPTYSAHTNVGMFCIAALLVGGASVEKASIGNVFLGVILFHTMFIVAPRTGMVITGDSMIGEYFRVFISYGVITVALIMYETKKRKSQSLMGQMLAQAQKDEEEGKTA